MMDIRECYEKMGADYDDVSDRMGSEKLVERFTGRFLDDKSYQMIIDGIKEKDAETAFRGAHTLKGVCLNLGFSRLYEASRDLTEILRDRKLEGYEEALDVLKETYQSTVKAICEWQQGKDE